jgi:hypothetical protein
VVISKQETTTKGKNMTNHKIEIYIGGVAVARESVIKFSARFNFQAHYNTAEFVTSQKIKPFNTETVFIRIDDIPLFTGIILKVGVDRDRLRHVSCVSFGWLLTKNQYNDSYVDFKFKDMSIKSILAQMSRFSEITFKYHSPQAEQSAGEAAIKEFTIGASESFSSALNNLLAFQNLYIGQRAGDDFISVFQFMDNYEDLPNLSQENPTINSIETENDAAGLFSKYSAVKINKPDGKMSKEEREKRTWSEIRHYEYEPPLFDTHKIYKVDDNAGNINLVQDRETVKDALGAFKCKISLNTLFASPFKFWNVASTFTLDAPDWEIDKRVMFITVMDVDFGDDEISVKLECIYKSMLGGVLDERAKFEERGSGPIVVKETDDDFMPVRGNQS